MNLSPNSHENTVSVSISGFDYLINQSFSKVSWNDAEEYCMRNGSHLWSVTSVLELFKSAYAKNGGVDDKERFVSHFWSICRPEKGLYILLMLLGQLN